MTRKLTLAGGVVALIAALTIPTAHAAAPVQLVANLKGATEVPGPGDPNGTGEAIVVVKRKLEKVCFSLSWRRIGQPRAAHIHKGRRGEAGPVKVLLFEDASGLPSPGEVQGCVPNVGERLLRRLARHPRRFYVNIHNGAYPDGAIRGQLKPAL